MERRSRPRHASSASVATVGNTQIDQEHAALVDHLDRLQADPKLHPASEVFTDLMSRIGRQINAHFDSEEEILRTCGMPDEVVVEHVMAHTEILDQYARLNLDMMNGNEFSREEALALIRHWIVEHVLHHDVKISAFLPPVARQG